MKKTIFNSLGSNYDFSLATKALKSLVFSDLSSSKKFIKKIGSLWQVGSICLAMKGRDAIELGLRGLNVGIGDVVLTQALSCIAVEEAIIRSGAKPVYYDLVKNKLKPSVETLELAYQRSINLGFKKMQIKAVIVQHTLGVPAPILEIRNWCRQHDLFLIEDLAQAVGAKDKAGNLLGSNADAVIFSFGRDKILDAISGGAVVFKIQSNKSLSYFIFDQTFSLGVIRDMTYPILTWLIRKTFGLGFGRVLLKVIQSFGIWQSPVLADCNRPTKMLPAYAGLVLERLKNLSKELEHRQKIAKIYQSKLKKYSLLTDDDIESGSNQRYSILVSNPRKFVDYMKKHWVFLSDRWYRSPVDSGSLHLPSVYQPGSCPNAEKVASQIVNLPTHMNISQNDALRICQLSKIFLESQ